jgi:hypothetical protein
MKNIFRFLFLIFLFHAVPFAADRNLRIQTILDIHLPTKVSAMVDKLGPTGNVEVPTPKELAGTPQGQWFRWNLSNGLGKKVAVFSVLGDEYSLTPNYEASVRFISYMATKDNHADVLDDFKFNKTTRKDIENKFRGHTLLCKGNYGKWPGGVIKVPEEEGFTYFFFSPAGVLTGVAQSTFDMDKAG